MSSSATPFLKSLSMGDSCLLSGPSTPSIFSVKDSLYVPIPPKSFKLHLLCSQSSVLSSTFSLKKKFLSPIVALVAKTSDWAQQEENNVDTIWESQESEFLDANLPNLEAGHDGGEIFQYGFGDERVEETNPLEERKLFVGNLPYEINQPEDLASIFSEAGVVENVEIIVNRETGKSRGFGFVIMATAGEAEKAVEMFHRYDVSGRLLTVNKAAPRGTQPERLITPSRIYVGNLPWSFDNGRLEQIFSEYGKVVEARIVFDRETGRSRGFGFVTMSTEDELNDAIAALDGQELDGRTIRVNVAEARPKSRSF